MQRHTFQATVGGLRAGKWVRDLPGGGVCRPAGRKPRHTGPDWKSTKEEVVCSTESLHYNSFFEMRHQKRRRVGFVQMGFSCDCTAWAGQQQLRWLGCCRGSSPLPREWEQRIRGRGSRHPFRSCVDILVSWAQGMQMPPRPW